MSERALSYGGVVSNPACACSGATAVLRSHHLAHICKHQFIKRYSVAIKEVVELLGGWLAGDDEQQRAVTAVHSEFSS